MELVRQTLANNQVLTIEKSGALFLINSVTAPLDLNIYKLGSSIFQAEQVSRGLKIKPESGFDRVSLTNNSGANNTVEFFVANGDIDIQVQEGINVTVDNTVSNPIPVIHTGTVNLTASNIGIKSANVLSNPVDLSILTGARGLVVAAAGVGVVNREVIIKNLNANADAFRVGNVACDATHGHELGAGETITLNTLAAVYVWNTSANTQAVSVLINEL